MRKYLSYILLMALFACASPSDKKTSSDEKKEKIDSSNRHHHQHGDANAHMHKTDFATLVSRFESPERIQWQKPENVLSFLGNLKGKVIMDIGAGTGFMSFRMVNAGAKVIAADVDKRFLQYIENKRDSLQIDTNQLFLREIPYDAPALANKEVDMVIMTNVYHHIENRPAYFKKVLSGLKENGRLVVIDFKKEETPAGPPLKMRMEASEVEKELREAGFTNFEINQELLPYQYIVVAKS